MARLALNDPIKFDAELRHRTKSWVRTIRDRADDLSAGSAHEVADEAVAEMKQLVAKAPSIAAAASNVAAAIRHSNDGNRASSGAANGAVNCLA